MQQDNTITIQALINAPLKKVWDAYINPTDILIWNTASNDWHTTKAENDLKVGGKFTSRMEAKDGSFGFDFSGVYTQVIPNNTIAYTMDDGRVASINFDTEKTSTKILIQFEAETENSHKLQQQGWQAILNNFKNYVEVM